MADTAVRTTTALLAVEDVAVHFGGVKAVDGISLEMHQGNIYGVLGPNGSGKSTLLGAMTRLTPLTRGRFLLDGVDYTKVPARKVHRMGISRTFQTVRLLDDRSVRDNILLGQDTLPKQTRKAAAMQVDEVMERVGVREVAQLRPDELSYGMQRRVEFARAIIGRPRLLLLDEPTAGMNAADWAGIGDLVRQVRDRGTTVIVVEHNMRLIETVCDQVAVLASGEVIACDEPVACLRRPEVRKAYFGK